MARESASPRRLAFAPSLVLVTVYLFTPASDPWLRYTLLLVSLGALAIALLSPMERPVLASIAVTGALLLTPSAFGERNNRIGLSLLMGAATLEILRTLLQRTRTASLRVNIRAILPLMSLAGYWAIVSMSAHPTGDARTFAIYFFLLAMTALVLQIDRRLTTSILALFGSAVGVAGLLALVGLALGALGVIEPYRIFAADGMWRSKYTYLSWANVTITNSSGWLVDRVTAIAGEPGTWAIYCAIAIVAGNRLQGRLGVLVGAGAVCGFVLSQSSGALILAVLAIAVVLAMQFLSRTNGVNIGPVLVVLAIAMTIVPLWNLLVSVKAESSLSSLTDRGFDWSGGFTGSTSSRINLISLWGLDGISAVLVLGALTYTVVAFRRNRVDLCLGIFIFACATLLQPTHYHLGHWYAITVLLGQVIHERDQFSSQLGSDGMEGRNAKRFRNSQHLSKQSGRVTGNAQFSPAARPVSIGGSRS